MVKSWVLLLAGEGGNGTPSSGSPAQEAVWPGETETLAWRSGVPAEEDKDKALKDGVSRGSRKAFLFRPSYESRPDAAVRNADWCDWQPAFQAADPSGTPCFN